MEVALKIALEKSKNENNKDKKHSVNDYDSENEEDFDFESDFLNNQAEKLQQDHVSSINILTLNINSARKKQAKLEVLVKELQVDIICLNETDNNENFLKSEWIGGYDLLGFENKGNNGKCGGVAVLIRRAITPLAKIIDINSSSKEDHQIVTFAINDHLFAAAYRSPNATSELAMAKFNDDVTKIVNKSKQAKKNVVIIGDLNPGSFKFDTAVGGTASQKQICKHLLKKGFHQMITQVTFPASGNTLDLFLTSAPGRVLLTNTVETDFTNHLGALIVLKMTIFQPEPIEIDDYKNADWDLYRQELDKVHWPKISSLYPRSTTMEELNDFYNFVVGAILKAKEKSIPKRTKFDYGDRSIYIDSEIRRIIKGRRAIRKYCSNEALKKSDDRLRELRNLKIAQVKKDFFEGLEKDRNFLYKHFKSFRTKVETVYNAVYKNDLKNPPDYEIITENKERAQILQDAFMTNQQPMKPGFPWIDGNIFEEEKHLTDMTILPLEMAEELLKLENSNFAGFDEISKNLLKAGYLQLAAPLCDLFTLIIDVGVLPEKMQVIEVFPIPKNAKFLYALNNRPVCEESETLKCLEGCVMRKYNEYFEKTGQFTSQSQFGFSRGRNCIILLILQWHLRIRHIDIYGAHTMCYLDLSKAFERVCLKALYTTYFDKGIRCRALRFLRAWIHPRQQHVKIGTEYSTRNALTSGVFQGRLRKFYSICIRGNFTSNFDPADRKCQN